MAANSIARLHVNLNDVEPTVQHRVEVPLAIRGKRPFTIESGDILPRMWLLAQSINSKDEQIEDVRTD